MRDSVISSESLGNQTLGKDVSSSDMGTVSDNNVEN